MSTRLVAALSVAALGVVLALLVVVAVQTRSARREIALLRAQVVATQNRLPGQSHTMTDVDYQFSSLWHAAQAENWPLAEFFLDETIEHLEWTVSLQPVRRLPDGGGVDLRPILDVMEQFSLAELDRAVEAQDLDAFADAYGFVIDQCHGCHVEAGLPQLRPHVPEAPATRMLELRPPPA